MRTRGPIAAAAAAALLLAACSDGGDEDSGATEDSGAAEEGAEAPTDDGVTDDGATDDPPGGDGEAAPDPNESVEDGVFAGSGVLLPVPEGFTLDPAAAAQGAVAAFSEDGEQQISAIAVDAAALGEASGGEELTLDALIESSRTQFPEEPAVDEAIELEGAAEAYQLSYEGIEAEGQPPLDATLLLADDGDGRLAQFSYLAASETFASDVEEALLTSSGFDPDSDPAPPAPPPGPAPAPGPEGGAGEGEAPEGEAPAG